MFPLQTTPLLDSLDIFIFWLLNVSASFMLSAAHNVLFFVLDWHTPVLHFLHFASLLAFLLFKSICSPLDRPLLPALLVAPFHAPLRTILWPPVAIQFVVCLLSAQVHSQNRTGSLYLIRLFDFLGTFVVVRFAPRFLSATKMHQQDLQRRRSILLLLMPLALSASLSWLEFGHIEYDPWALFLSPVLAVAQGLHLLLLKRSQMAFFRRALGHHRSPIPCPHCRCPPPASSLPQSSSSGATITAFLDHPTMDFLFHRFSLCYAIALLPLLAIPALFSYAQSKVPYDASWESIDIALMWMSVVFMIGYKYSELWLQTRLEPHHFCALEHTKFFMASIGQWFLQNMAHATIFAALGKALFVASALRYWTRMGEMRAKEKCGRKSSLAPTEEMEEDDEDVDEEMGEEEEEREDNVMDTMEEEEEEEEDADEEEGEREKRSELMD